MVTLKETRELSRLLIMGALALVAGSFLIGWLISTSAVSDLFQERAQVVQGYDVNERFSAQIKAINAILEHPLGIGPGQADLQFGIVPHNVYLYIFSECGWVAGSAYLAFVILTLWKGFLFCLRRTEIQLTSLVIFSCILSTQLQSFFIDSTHWRHLFILHAMMWGVMLGYDKTENHNPR
jgi:O-antigen ligase